MVYVMACADDNYTPSAKFQFDTALKRESWTIKGAEW